MKERQDSKGRKLKDGEGQRNNGLYYYRYTDSSCKRLTVYAPALSQLREKEKDLQLQLAQGIRTVKGKRTLGNMIDKHFALKKT